MFHRLRDAAHRDPLTDLLNRRGFQASSTRSSSAPGARDQALSLIVGDLDRFKRVNDAHGHAAGDAVLERVADAIRGAKRGFDSAARIGGEEFAVLAPDCDEHGAYMLAERIRAAVHEALSEREEDGAAHDQLRHLDLPAPRPVGRRAAPHRRPGALRRQAARPQPLGDLERRGAGHPRARSRSGTASPTWSSAALLTLAEALDVRDTGSATHCQRVGRFAELTARELGLPPEAVERVRLAGILHDVGRVAFPDSCWRSRARSPTTSGPGCARTRRSARVWSRRPTTRTSAPGSCSTTSAPTAAATRRAAGPRRSRSSRRSSPSRTPTRP